MIHSDTIHDAFLTIVEWISGSLRDIVFLGLITFFMVLIIFGIRSVLLTFLLKKKINQKNRLRWRRNSSYISVLIIIVLLFPILIPSLHNFLAVIGIFGAGVLLVLKETIVNIAGWFYIIVRRPFEEGNRVSISGYLGDIIEVRLQEFTMIEVKKRLNGEQSTGRILHIPNSHIFSDVLANSSKEFSFNWHEILIPVTLKSDWNRAVDIIREIAKEKLKEISGDDVRLKRSEDEYAIRYNRLEPGVYIELNKGAVIITLRYLVEPRNLRQVSDVLWREILDKFSKEKEITLCENPDIWSGRD